MNAVLEELRNSASDFLPSAEAESLAREAYSLIGQEYYDSRHVTCRNFDAAIDAFLTEHPLGLRPGFRYIEVGCGRSRLVRYGRPDARVVLLDICGPMLEHSLRCGIRNASALLASAFSLPFCDQAFAAVFAFLADPFLHPTYLAEVRRMLKPGGSMFHVVPAYEWGATLRSSRQAPLHFSHFFRGAHEVFGPSYLLPKTGVIDLLEGAGFENIRLADLFLPSAVTLDRISPDIASPAALQGISPYKLPILTAIEAVAR